MAIKQFTNSKEYNEQPRVGVADIDKNDVLMPTVTGVFYIIPIRTPDSIDKDELKLICREFASKITTPDRTHNEAVATYGFNGTSKASAPTTVEEEKKFDLSFNETGMKVTDTLKPYFDAIRDPHTGLSTIVNYTQRNLTIDFLVIFTKPVLSAEEAVIDSCYVYKGARLTNLPFSTVSVGDKEASDKIDLTTSWSFREKIDNDIVRQRATVALKDIIEEIKAQRDVV